MLDTILSVLTLKTLLVGLLTGLAVRWIRRWYKYKLPPGPFPLPLVGNLLQFKSNMLHEELYALSKKYGPVVSIYLGPMLVITINDINCAMEVLVKKGTDFSNKFRTTSLEIVSDGGRDIAFSDYGPSWRIHRKIAAKALRQYMQGEALEGRVHDAVSVIFEEMKKETKPFDPELYIDFIVCNILSGLCFGGKYEFNDPEIVKLLNTYDELVKDLSNGVIPEDVLPILQYVWESEKMRKLKQGYASIVDNFLRKKYNEHVATYDRGNIRDFADTLILARQEAEEDLDEKDAGKLTDTHIVQTLLDVFLGKDIGRTLQITLAGGIDTSRLTLRYALLHMAAYPEIQDKVRAEIDSVVGFDELPKMVHRPKLPYTEAVLHESMRLSSVIPTGTLHVSACDTTIGPYDVPKKTLVLVNYWALLHDPDKWENVDDFIPERYLDENGKLGPKPESWLPFSAGRRVCLGETVAKPELHLIFACLMQRFTWQLPEGVKADLSPDGTWFSLVPKPHKLIVKEREM